MSRLTEQDLDRLVFNLNVVCNRPLARLVPIDGKWRVGVGHYWINSAHGKHRLVETIDEAGNYRQVIGERLRILRQCHDELRAFYLGVLVGREVKNKC